MAQVKSIDEKHKYIFVNRRALHARAVTTVLAKLIVEQLDETDFVQRAEDWDYPGEYLWIFETQFGEIYYIKFKFVVNNLVKFISFHVSTSMR
ncbi:type II toxin-antitoxin system MqsR family toxin [Lactiplantibacillus daoliensis]|uniref:Type II toxin-antitoxin system MqsR family toxin n=1 Tax=Lactiplantibacillus daoliensis TaxID=2559916 RepID=A0ABW1UKN0_9LACO|nr:type II toxin-antitoxin system MqsR family toxin [Lactiplantibacillus daoliensis]